MSLPSPRLLACTFALLALSFTASAQRVVGGDLQREMTSAEFKAAGLDKLQPAELANLNRWLQGKVEAVANQAVEAAREEGRQEVIVKNRGFLDFGSSEPITSTLQGPFTGFGKGKVFVLANGQHWEQTDGTSGSRRQQDPKVTITPGVMGVWYMKVDGLNSQAKVKLVK